METVIQCSNMGLSGAEVFFKETDNGYEARQAVALFGEYQMHKLELEAIDYNPFHKDFHDNFVKGIGKTKEEAIEALKKDAKKLADSLWY